MVSPFSHYSVYMYEWVTECPPMYHWEVTITKSAAINRRKRWQLFSLSWRWTPSSADPHSKHPAFYLYCPFLILCPWSSWTSFRFFWVTSPVLFPLCLSLYHVSTSHWPSPPPPPVLQVFHAGDLWRGSWCGRISPLCSLVQKVWLGV